MKTRRGFTLLELLLATAMISMLALSLYATLRIAFRARDSALNAVAPARSAQMAMGLLGRDIESALPPGGLLSGEFIGDVGTEVSGTSYLRFYCVGSEAPEVRVTADPTSATGAQQTTGLGAETSRDPTRFGGVQTIELMVRQVSGTNDTALVRRTTRTPANLSSVEPEAEEEILCRGVRGFVVRYLDSTSLTWLDVWDSTQNGNLLPAAVEATIELDTPAGITGRAPSADARTAYRTTRTFFLACHDPNATTSTTTQGGGL
jgi:prepilin-type N-terminal cleavage/methylation domain-containing protein